ncbi:MAG: hypothetical protein C0392_09785 [Syntrophus sp. (in: bacteria)]|nr:hypothetical protein [Syntrophus sp. (in: bacteria)]
MIKGTGKLIFIILTPINGISKLIKLFSAKKMQIIIINLLIMSGLWACAFSGKKPVDKQPVKPASAYNVPLNAGVADAAFLSDMEKEIIKQMNDLRVFPRGYADYLKDLRNRSIGIAQQEGATAVDKEQISEGMEGIIVFLGKKERLTPLRASRGLSLAARDIVNDHGPRGLTGHKGSDGKSPFDRMKRYGGLEGDAAENLIYGYRDADAVLIGMLIDGSINGRDQRKNLFNNGFNLIGVACGMHKVYGFMCAINLAAGYRENP